MKRTAALMLAALTVALLAATCCVPASALDMSASTVNISSAADLIALAEYVNTHSENKNDYSATAGKTFVLTTDIDLNPGMDVTALKEGEKPVVWDGIRTFGGTFEGNSHTIKGLYNDGTFDYTTSDGAGALSLCLRCRDSRSQCGKELSEGYSEMPRYCCGAYPHGRQDRYRQRSCK